LILFFALSCYSIFAANPVSVKQFINHQDWNFVENKGQLINPPATFSKGESATNNIVRYYGHQGGVYLYCMPGKISFVFTKAEKESEEISEATSQQVSDIGVQYFEPLHTRQQRSSPSALRTSISSSRADLILLNSNPSAQIIASDQQEYYENFYFTNTPEEGITNVHTFKTITYKEIYPHIDMVLHSREEGMKYEFVVYPGGKVSDVQMQWNGIERIKKLKNSGIEYSCALGKMDESAPVTYQCASPVWADPCVRPGGLYSDIGRTHRSDPTDEIESHFVLKNNIIRFKIAAYDKAKPLVIDPTLVWGTYFGGSGEDIGLAVATDDSGQVYLTGQTSSASSIATSGAYQTSFVGVSHDAFLAKFNNKGLLLWSTYFGGDQGTQGFGLATDGAAFVYLSGTTSSKYNIATSGAYQTSNVGGLDAFISKFNGLGILQWSTYYGGASVFISGITSDFAGNITITGSTTSPSGIATKGAYQTSLSGSLDAFLARFNKDGQLQWASYFGGPGQNWGEAVTYDNSGNIYISGYTYSSSGIATNGAYQTFLEGAEDAFLAKFSDNGAIQWATYYGSGRTEGYGVTSDSKGFVYITGATSSDSNIATSGAFQTSFGGFEDVFLAKFNSNGVRQWATYFGGDGDDEASSIVADAIGNVYFTGYTSSEKGIATNGAYQTAYSNSSSPSPYNVFLAQFNGVGLCQYATYYGGYTGGGNAHGIAIDKSANIYFAGGTGSSTGIATSGTYQTVYAGNTDAFLVKFDVKIPVTDLSIAGFYNPKDSVCPGQESQVIVNIKNNGPDTNWAAFINWTINAGARKYRQFGGNISPGDSLLIYLGNFQFTGDNDTIIAWVSPIDAIDTVPENDTGKIIVHFYKRHFAGTGQSSYTICTGTHIRIGTNGFNGNTYRWSSSPPGFTSTVSNPIVNPDSFTTYYLTETNTRTGCTNTDTSTVNVKVVKAPVANAGKSHSICFGDSTLIGSGSVSGLSYSWSSYPSGFSSELSKAYVKPIITTIYTVQVTNSTGCTDINNDTITVNNPKAITGPPQSICSGSVINLGAAPIAGHTYLWTSKPTGFTSVLSDPVDSPNITRIYYLTEKITATGCSHTDSVLITVMPKPDVKIQTDSVDVFTRKFVAINPNYPTNMYKWSISDSDSATGYSIVHTFRNGGGYKAALTVSLPGFCMETDTVSINIKPQFSLNIFPNPFSTQTDIRYILVTPAHIKIQIADIIGREIKTLVNEELTPGEFNTTLNATTRAGVYIVIFMMDNTIITRKIVQVGSIFY